MDGPAEHRHCKVCGKVAELDSDTCSPSCRRERERRIQSRRGYTYLLYAFMAIVVVVFLVNLLRV